MGRGGGVQGFEAVMNIGLSYLQFSNLEGFGAKGRAQRIGFRDEGEGKRLTVQVFACRTKAIGFGV